MLNCTNYIYRLSGWILWPILLVVKQAGASVDGVQVIELANQSSPFNWVWVAIIFALILMVSLASLVYRLVKGHIGRLSRELEQANTKLQEAQQIARMGSWHRDYGSGETYWSPEALRVFETQDQEKLKHYEALVHPDDMEQVVEVIAEAYHRGGNYECEHRIFTPSGDVRHIRLAGRVFLDDNNSGPVREMGTVQDITERKKAEENVRSSELKLRSILESAPYPIMIFELENSKVRYANQSTYRLFEFPLEKSLVEISDMNSFWIQEDDRNRLMDLLADEGDIQNHEMLMKTAKGKMFWALLSATKMDFGGEQALFVSLLDVTEKKLIQEELERLATSDPLTGIYNRRSYFDMANKELRRSVRYNYPFSLLMIDIDNFKRVNDTYGHAFGDEVIQKFCEVCNECLREEDIFGRVGGEEFSVILVSAELDGAATVAERIRERWQDTGIQFEGKHVSFTVSIGVSELQNPRESVDMVMERADKALYQAKSGGRNQVRIEALSLEKTKTKISGND